MRRAIVLATLASVLAGPAAARAVPDASFGLDVPTPCAAGSCSVLLTYDPARLADPPGQLSIAWDHKGAPDAPLAPDVVESCGLAPLPGALAPAFQYPCEFASPPYATPGPHTVVLQVRARDGSVARSARTVPVTATRTPSARPSAPSRPAPAQDGGYALCQNVPPNVVCKPGDGMRTAGGGEKVSHKGWPAITGVFWKVNDDQGRAKTGGPDNDELLGHHGSDQLDGAGGKDVLWGDWDPKNNNSSQRDVLIGGPGNDFIYPSHGTTRVQAGPGQDHVWAFYGRGTIDCGPGYDTVRVRTNGAFKLRNCEVIGHFCQYGSDGKGGCLKPGESRKPRNARLTR